MAKTRTATAFGYREAPADGHPLGWDNGAIAEHRRVLYDSIGPGPHPCCWCGASVMWAGPRGSKKLYVDHLDHNRLNNDPTNLVPSCMHCNIKRHPAEQDFQPGRLSAQCKRGHPLAEDNLYWNNKGQRRCRQCFLDYMQRYRASH